MCNSIMANIDDWIPNEFGILTREIIAYECCYCGHFFLDNEL